MLGKREKSWALGVILELKTMGIIEGGRKNVQPGRGRRICAHGGRRPLPL